MKTEEIKKESFREIRRRQQEEQLARLKEAEKRTDLIGGTVEIATDDLIKATVEYRAKILNITWQHAQPRFTLADATRFNRTTQQWEPAPEMTEDLAEISSSDGPNEYGLPLMDDEKIYFGLKIPGFIRLAVYFKGVTPQPTPWITEDDEK